MSTTKNIYHIERIYVNARMGGIRPTHAIMRRTLINDNVRRHEVAGYCESLAEAEDAITVLARPNHSEYREADNEL